MMEIDPTKAVAVYAGLLLFGIGYNWLVGQLERLDHGYTALLVVGGVLTTVLATGWLVGLDAMLVVLAGFAASGLPMVTGSMLRWLRRQQAERDAWRASAQAILTEGEPHGHAN